jgi:hypothetical protein
MMIQLLACEFVSGLRRELTLPALAQAVGENMAEPHESICHTHDYCDANMVMYEAFKAVLGREPAWNEGNTLEAMQEADLDLVNKAWTLAMDLLKQEFK